MNRDTERKLSEMRAGMGGVGWGLLCFRVMAYLVYLQIVAACRRPGQAV